MKRHALALAALLPLFTAASANAAPSVGEYLSDAEQLDACAEQLPKQLACKEEFCSAMVDIRKKHQPRFAAIDRAEMVKGCLAEIAVDGTGDHQTRRARCEGWSKGRPALKVARTEAAASNACFEKPTCEARIACWAPITDKQMASLKK
jgi:hypothetical protein